MSSVILTPMGTMARSAASATPYAIALMAVLGFCAWLIRLGSESQAAASRRASFLRSLAGSTEAIPPELYAAYVADPDWRGTALRAITDADQAHKARVAIRAALAAA